MNKMRGYDLSGLGQKHQDHKMTNDEVLALCADRVQWLQDQLFGIRGSDGKLMKDEYKDKDGNVKQVTYRVGMLQKIEGVVEMNEETKQPEVKQPGLEQLFTGLQQELLYLSENFERLIIANKTQTAMFATVMKITPQEWFDITGDKNQEMNVWIQNYKNILEAYEAKEKAEAEKQSEALKDFKPNE